MDDLIEWYNVLEWIGKKHWCPYKRFSRIQRKSEIIIRRYINEHPDFEVENSVVRVVRNDEKMDEWRGQQLLKYLKLFKPDEPMKKPIFLKVIRLLAKGKNTQRQGVAVYKTRDADKVEKMLKDTMIKMGFWEDDAQAVRNVERGADKPTEITIENEILEKFYKFMGTIKCMDKVFRTSKDNRASYIWHEASLGGI